MSDTVVVMNGGKVQQIGTPEDIYNEPKNAFVADFIGDSNIVDGVMHKDFLVSFSGVDFPCVDRGIAREQSVQVVVRPEDIEVALKAQGSNPCTHPFLFLGYRQAVRHRVLIPASRWFESS